MNSHLAEKSAERTSFNKPLVIDLCAGLGGWTEAFMAEGYRCVGFDIQAHDYGQGGYPGELVLRDIRSLTGKDLVKEFGNPPENKPPPRSPRFRFRWRNGLPGVLNHRRSDWTPLN
jgi:hypothetical protein